MQSFPFLFHSQDSCPFFPGSFGRSTILFLPLSLSFFPHIYPTFHPSGPDFVLIRAVTPTNTHIHKNAKKTHKHTPSNIIITMIWGRVNSKNKSPGFIAPAEKSQPTVGISSPAMEIPC